jgi:hypothetical protein
MLMAFAISSTVTARDNCDTERRLLEINVSPVSSRTKFPFVHQPNELIGAGDSASASQSLALRFVSILGSDPFLCPYSMLWCSFGIS